MNQPALRLALICIAAALAVAGGCAPLTPQGGGWPTGLTAPVPAPTPANGNGAAFAAGANATSPAPSDSLRPQFSPGGTTLRKPPLDDQSARAHFDVRGQSPAPAGTDAVGPDGYSRYGVPVSGTPLTGPAPVGSPVAFPAGSPPAFPAASGVFTAPPPPAAPANPTAIAPNWGGASGYLSPFAPGVGSLPPPGETVPNARTADIDTIVRDTETGRFMFGVGVNSDLGVTGQIVVDERNFDLFAVPSSWDDVWQGKAFRGAGQGFRLEAMPGTQSQRYLFNFSEPYLFGTNVSYGLSGYYFSRAYVDYHEERLGGYMSWGYRLTPDLSATVRLKAEQVGIFNPRVNTVPELNNVVGRNDVYSGRFGLVHDTRDQPFFPTEGHFIELAFEQAFGDFSYPRGTFEYRKYWMLYERPDGSGRHTVDLQTRVGISGSDTPMFENFFAGGYSTMRGFAFRGASPVVGGVITGGQFEWLNSLEYVFPITADDMLKGMLFVDFGTVEKTATLSTDEFRVVPGFGLRISVPAMGPAPIALDFGFPVHSAPSDQRQVFSFYFGMNR